jgi:ABC-type Mn2+/Zn2+ transport system permease subunit
VSTLVEILRPDFLLRDALLGSLLVGAVCPLIGVYFLLRRMIFLGVALPQLSAAGIALAFLVYRSVVGVHQHFEPNERLLAMAGSFAVTLLGLLVLASLERGGREMVEARIGTTYALAAAATILFLAADPYGEADMVNLLKGDVLTASGGNLTLLAAVLAAVVLALFAFRRELLLVSFDRDMAVAIGKNVAVWDTVLYLLIGVTISFGVMTVGPLVTFGFLVVPPLTARLVTRRMLSFSLVAGALGAGAAAGGADCAYRFDLPLGPTDDALASGVLLAIGTVTAWRVLRRRG